MGAKKEMGQTAVKLARGVLKKWVCFFGTPDIILADKDARFAGGDRPLFCDRRNIALQTVIPGRHQSLGILKGDIGILET